MKWFKHETNASQDAKLKRLRMKFGLEGLGFYWYCLELIGATIEPHNLSFELEHSADVLANDLNNEVKHIQEILDHIVNLGLFEKNGDKITCQKMRIRSDEYTRKVIRDTKKSGHPKEKTPTVSGQAPDKVPSIRKKEEKEEKEERESFSLPGGINTKAWEDYLQYKADKGSPLKGLTVTKTLEQLKALPHDDQQLAVDRSILNGWKGLYPKAKKRIKQSTYGANGI